MKYIYEKKLNHQILKSDLYYKRVMYVLGIYACVCCVHVKCDSVHSVHMNIRSHFTYICTYV